MALSIVDQRSGPDLDTGSPFHGFLPIGGARARGDVQLIEAVRCDVAAYGDLYAHHVGYARRLARQLSRTAAEADDLVSEAFIRTLNALRAGGGPDSAIRAYLRTAVRHAAYDRYREERRVELSGDITDAVDGVLASVPLDDTATATVEKALVRRAFAQLPERWKMVLRLIEVEGRRPADVAQNLGLTPNGVSALTYRAREALRQAYLQVHLSGAEARRCEPTTNVLGAWTRGGVSKRRARQVELHLAECVSCRALSTELAEINSAFRAAKRSAVRPSRCSEEPPASLGLVQKKPVVGARR